MPNWSMNTLAVKGKKQEVINFFNQAIIKKENQLTIDMSGDEIANRLCSIKNGKNPITLRSWLPIPKTFVKWDTTNAILNYESWKFHKLGKVGFNKPSYKTIKKYKAMSEDELKAKYEQYTIGYEKAKKEQQEKYGIVGWYDYNCATLGTKWDSAMQDFQFNEFEDTLVIRMYCETAWNLPEMWLRTMQEKNPNLSFYCYAWEESYEYCGYFKADNADWTENYGRDFYDDCIDELKAKGEYNEDDGYETIQKLVGEKQDGMYERFIDYVLND